MAPFDLVVRATPWAGEHAVPMDDALSSVVWSIEVNGHRIGGTSDVGVSLALDPFPTLWLERVETDGWEALDADPDDFIHPDETTDGMRGIPIRKIEFVFEPPPTLEESLAAHDRSV